MITSTHEGSMPSSSFASLKAVATSSASSSSRLPPGKQTSPACFLNFELRCVRITCISPSDSKRGISTAACLVDTGRAGVFEWCRRRFATASANEMSLVAVRLFLSTISSTRIEA